MSIKIFSANYLEDLVDMAKKSPRLRQHSNIHVDYSDPCQRLFNAIEPDSYIQPHCHGVETLFAVRGLMALILFDDNGVIEKIQKFGANSNLAKSNIAIGTETPLNKWHTVVALDSGSILLEIKAGPFNPCLPKVLAPWAPVEGAIDSSRYLHQLKRLINKCPI